MDQFLELTGRFHPLLVHLPIGFLLIAVIFIWLNESNKVVRICLGLGAVAAVCSVITGLVLESSGDYESVGIHKWLGITLAVTSLVLWLSPHTRLKAGSIFLTIMIFATGHFGGTLTHGPLLAGTSDVETPDISKLDVNTAVFYADAVKPVLEARCYGCHGEEKQKGKLRLDNPEMILKGGKNGKIIEPGNPAESEMIVRLDLPVDDEDHMPPKEKKQLTDQEKKLIALWVESGADFSKKITEVVSQKKFGELFSDEKTSIGVPDIDVPAPDQDVITKLIEQGAAISPVAKESNFLQVNFVSVPEETQKLLPILKPIAENVVSLKLTSIEDLSVIKDFKNLFELDLSGATITDAGIDEIVKLNSLTTLNLQGTKVTAAGVRKLTACTNLRRLNLYNTPAASAQQEIIEALPHITIEFGGYQVPTLHGDTTVVKPN